MKKAEMLKFTGEVRDPIYGYIHYTRLEEKIIGTFEFQRLDRISQMPTARLVYPGASHSRKIHSLGTMHLMGKALSGILGKQSKKQLSHCGSFTKKKDSHLDILGKMEGVEWWKNGDMLIEIARLCGLLHDIGHGPFNHLFEDIFKDKVIREKIGLKKTFDHEEQSRKIIQHIAERFESKESDLSEILGHVIEVLDPASKIGSLCFFHELINGCYDCDMLDYLPRDAYFSGTKEYGLDVERITDGFRVYGGHLKISSDAFEATMNFFKCLYSMYSTVYYHRVSRIFDFMIYDVLIQVPDLLEEIVKPPITNFLKHDDYSLIHRIEARKKQGKGYRSAWRILEALRKREKIYKQIFGKKIGLRLITSPGPLYELQKFKRDFEAEWEGKGVGIHLDLREIRPIRLRPEVAFEFLRKENFIYDESEKKEKAKRLGVFSPHDLRTLAGFTIELRLYANEKDLRNRKLKEKAISKPVKDKVDEIIKEMKEDLMFI